MRDPRNQATNWSSLAFLSQCWCAWTRIKDRVFAKFGSHVWQVAVHNFARTIVELFSNAKTSQTCRSSLGAALLLLSQHVGCFIGSLYVPLRLFGVSFGNCFASGAAGGADACHKAGIAEDLQAWVCALRRNQASEDVREEGPRLQRSRFKGKVPRWPLGWGHGFGCLGHSCPNP